MKLLKLKLRGMIGIKKGLGVDEIEIDFTQFQSGLVALTGKNGTGKTSIMESLHPYRCMVSRSGSLQSHFFLKDSFRILEFIQDDNYYEAKILIDALTGGSEAYLIKNGTPLNDGKLTTYDEVLEAVLGSQELFFNSVFSGQKSKGIAELKPADRRKLFYELLNLNVYETHLEKAKGKLKANEIKLAEIEGQINSIDVRPETRSQLDENRIKALNGIANIELEITKLEDSIDKTSKLIEEGKVDLAKLEGQQRASEEVRLKIDELKFKRKTITEDHNKKKLKLQSEISDLTKLISQSQKLLQRKDEIEMNVERLKNLQTSYQTTSELKTDIFQKIYELQEEESKAQLVVAEKKAVIYKVEQVVKNIANKLDALNLELKRCETDASLISEVPCSDEVGSSCKFLATAHESSGKIKTIKEDIEYYRTQHSEELNRLKFLESEVEKITDENHKNINRKKGALTEDAAQINTELVKLKNSINEIIAYEGLERELKESLANNELLTQKLDHSTESLQEFDKMFEAHAMEIDGEIYNLASKVVDLTSVMFEKKNNIAKNTVTKTNLAATLKEKQSYLVYQQGVLSDAEAQLEQLKKYEVKIQELEIKKTIIQQEITDWTFLSKAFDKTGIPVLKLENSGVSITTIANELLSLFENKFRIVFETTKLKADKKTYKESFDINIVEEDGVCEISNKSGGQQVWLETAIQSAISLVVRQQGRNIQTSFLDEKDGALDLQNAESYIEMIQKAHEMSGVHNTFIITHRTELLNSIPQQIKLSDGVLSLLN